MQAMTVTYTPTSDNSSATWTNNPSELLKSLLVDLSGGYILDVNNTRIILGGDFDRLLVDTPVTWTPAS